MQHRTRVVMAMLAAVLVSLTTPSSAAHASVAFADSQGVQIAFEVVGEGDPIVLVPGFSQSRQAWKDAGHVEALLARGRQVILIDPRGHGDSDKPRDPSAYRPELLASDVVAVLDRLAIEQADLLGYSRGGAIAIAAAIAHPERLRRVIVGGAHPYAEDMTPFRRAIGPGLENWIGTIERNVGPLPDSARAMFLANDPEALRAAVAADRADVSAELAESGVPVLFYVGERDPRAHDVRRFVADFGGAFVELPELNHFEAFFAIDPVVRPLSTGPSP